MPQKRKKRQVNKLPVELISSNIAHEILARVETAEEKARDVSKSEAELQEHLKTMRKDAADSFARNLLFNIAERGTDLVVRRALAALGCPAEDDEIWARLESAREAKQRETGEQAAAN